jgi:hypothetical protein
VQRYRSGLTAFLASLGQAPDQALPPDSEPET